VSTGTERAAGPKAGAAGSGRAPGEVSRTAVAIAMAFLVILAVYFLLPVYWLVVNSTKTQSDLVTTNGFWFSGWALWDNLGALFTRDDGVFIRWVLNSVLYAGVGAAVGTLLAAMAGYALAKYSFRGRELIFSVVLGGVLVPATALALPLFLLFAKVSQTDTIAIWNNFLLPRIMLNDAKLYPLSYGLFYWQSQISRDPQLQTLVIAGSLVSVVPLIIVFLSLQRFWQAGLAAGSVK